MTGIDSIIWDKSPHTEAKHVILENYLKAWFPIMTRYNPKVVYLDGFAGPGMYSKGEEGSPLVAIRTARNHILSENFEGITFIFIEKDSERIKILKQILKQKFPDLPTEKWAYVVHEGEFDPSINSVLDNLEKQKLKIAPTFSFIDPFGYSEFPMNTIKRILLNDKCEVLITFMIDFINRFTDELHADVLNRLFGTEEWKEVRTIKDDPRKRQQFILELYEKQLKKIAGAKYTKTFEMVRDDGHTVYYLVFATKAWEGIKVIKDSMYKADERGTFRFSDREDPNQTFLTKFTNNDFWIPDASNRIFNEFKGKRISVPEVKIFVITETPYRFKSAILEHMEKSNPTKIINVEGRKVKGYNYPDRCFIQFAS